VARQDAESTKIESKQRETKSEADLLRTVACAGNENQGASVRAAEK
jgi:hypothetical protein